MSCQSEEEVRDFLFQKMGYKGKRKNADAGMLPDAGLNSLQGEEYGKEVVRKNARFLTDYFFGKCRKKDY